MSFCQMGTQVPVIMNSDQREYQSTADDSSALQEPETPTQFDDTIACIIAIASIERALLMGTLKAMGSSQQTVKGYVCCIDGWHDLQSLRQCILRLTNLRP